MKRNLLFLSGFGLAGLGAAFLIVRAFAGCPSDLRLPGTVEIQEVRLSSKVGGRVARVAVTDGALVQPGQPLVYLEAPELEKQRDQVRAKLHMAQAQLEKTRNG